MLYLLEIIQQVSSDLVITDCVFTSGFTVHLHVCPGWLLNVAALRVNAVSGDVCRLLYVAIFGIRK